MSSRRGAQHPNAAIRYRNMHERLRDALLGRWGRLVTTHPWLSLSVCVLIAAAGIWLAVDRLEFLTDRSDLVSPELPWNRRYAAYKQDFSHWDDVLLAIEGDADDGKVDAFVRRLARHLETNVPGIVSADAGFSAGEAPRLYQTAPASQFETALDGLVVLRNAASASNVNAGLATLLRSMQSAPLPAAPDSGEAMLRPLLDPALATLRGETAVFEFPGGGDTWRPLSTASGRIRLIWVSFRAPEGTIAGRGDQVELLRDAAREFIDRADVPPRFEWGVTGLRAIEADETALSTEDAARATILALGLIIVMMFLVFRGVRIPLLVTGALFVGLGWSFGWVVLSVGHLQLLSVVFSVMLLGLGVDFALHLIARLELVKYEHMELPPAMMRAFRGVGPGLITGAVTTAAAFAVIALTDFRGAAELGVISAGGILLCLVAILSTFPAMLAATKDWHAIVRHRPGGEAAHFMHGRLDFVARRPFIIVVVTALVIVALIALATRVRYDPNVLNLHPPGIESVEWEERLIEDNARSAWAALVRVEPEHAADMTRALRSLETVSEVEGMGLLFPPSLDERVQAVEIAANKVISPVPIAAGVAPLRGLLRQIESALRERATTNGGAPELADAMNEAIHASTFLPDVDLQAAWNALNESFLAKAQAALAFTSRALETQPLSPEDVPAALRNRWIGEDGSWLLRVQPAAAAGAGSILEPEPLAHFVESLRTVAPEVMGPPVQIHESSLLIQRAYVNAAMYALPVILILLILDFRSLLDALCAILPVVLGFTSAFGLMGMVGVPLNFANMIVMPIILGIGVDAGVHVVHRWRAQPMGSPPGLSGGTGRGVTLTMLTTIIGFGCMMIARHRGIQSLGFVMVVGLVATLLACYFTLPAILKLRGIPKHLEPDE